MSDGQHIDVVTARVALLGGGRVARAIARVLARQNGAPVSHWARDPIQRAALVAAVPSVRPAASIAEACSDATVVVLAVPATGLRDVARAFGQVSRGDQIVLHAARGVSAGFVLPHEIIRRETCVKKVAALGGPLYVDEAARDRPLVAVLAARFDEAFDAVRALVDGTTVRLHPTHDVLGVELAGAISLVATIAAGIAAGCGKGDTDQGLLLARGLLEASALGRMLGADAATFTGLAGIGDLIPRVVTTTQLHRKLGIAVASGARLADALAETSALEGPVTAREALRCAEAHGLALPLIAAVVRILDGACSPEDALERVLQLDLSLEPRAEREGHA